jgi:hypothetical protein
VFSEDVGLLFAAGVVFENDSALLLASFAALLTAGDVLASGS